MKVGFIVEPNGKGQIVIPKKVREDLNISKSTLLNLTVRGDSIWLYPVRSVLSRQESQDSKKVYLELLKKTQGILAGPYYKNEKSKKRLELESSQRRKRAWW